MIEKLIEGKIDIIGDIHGEYQALLTILKNLGYDNDGNHQENRKLVFVGDFCDRGPDSVSVIFHIKRLIDNGNAQAILGNHEINTLKLESKDGSGWFFKDREHLDKIYEPYKRVRNNEDRNEILNFLNSLPLALENDELRIVHSTWHNPSIEKIKNSNKKIIDLFIEYENNIENSIIQSGLYEKYAKEQEEWKEQIIDKKFKKIPFLPHTAQYNEIHQMGNPVRVISSGIEKIIDKPFYANGKWRFVGRDTWWDYYEDSKPVVIGHFWRKLDNSKYKESVFEGIEFNEWHGMNKNVFCVDYSVGARFRERNVSEDVVGQNTCLVALQWPEKTLVLENGEVIPTINFKNTYKIKNTI